MVYLKKWENFTLACQNLVDNADRPTRYTILFKASTGNLILKVTDDITCIKFKTNKSLYLNRFETFNRDLIKRYSNINNNKSSLPSSSSSSPTTTTLISTLPLSVTAIPKLKGDGDILMNEIITGGESIIVGGEESKTKKKKGKKKK